MVIELYTHRRPTRDTLYGAHKAPYYPKGICSKPTSGAMIGTITDSGLNEENY